MSGRASLQLWLNYQTFSCTKVMLDKRISRFMCSLGPMVYCLLSLGTGGIQARSQGRGVGVHWAQAPKVYILVLKVQHLESFG